MLWSIHNFFFPQLLLVDFHSFCLWISTTSACGLPHPQLLLLVDH